jgi:hypothetical protein
MSEALKNRWLKWKEQRQKAKDHASELDDF